MIMIIDDFYSNPDAVREYALSLDFNIEGNYPGIRTAAMEDGAWRASIQEHLETLLNKKIIVFPYGYNTAFQFTTKDSKTWIHHDSMSYAAVVYLSPSPDLNSGTAIYRHKSTGIMQHVAGQRDFNDETINESEWEIVAEAKNLYNRLVVYNSMYYHRSVVPGFGTDKETGRLFQTFFFEAESW